MNFCNYVYIYIYVLSFSQNDLLDALTFLTCSLTPTLRFGPSRLRGSHMQGRYALFFFIIIYIHSC